MRKKRTLWESKTSYLVVLIYWNGWSLQRGTFRIWIIRAEDTNECHCAYEVGKASY